MPTDLNRRLRRGRDRPGADLVDRVRPQRGDRCASCRGSASRSEGAVDSIQLVSRVPLEQRAHGRGHARERHVRRPDEGAAPRGRPRPARRGGRCHAADRRRGAEERLRGPDAALRPRPALARADWPADGVRRLGRARSTCAGTAELEDALVASVRIARAEPEQLAYEASERYGYPPGFLARYFEKLRYRFGPRERAGLYTFLEMAHEVGELDRMPELRFVHDRVPA